MDTMTLLCNLQAAGPATLRRLRERGSGSFEELLRAPIPHLAQALGADEATAARFQREAATLAQRCGSEQLEPEELDGSAPPPMSRPIAATPIPAIEPLRPPEMRPAPRRRLEPRQLPGLDEALCRALDDAGVRSLERLWEASAFELARRLNIPMTTLVDLQCEARRITTEGDATPADAGYTVIPASTPPLRAEPRAIPLPAEPRVTTPHADEQAGAGGPFA